VGLAESSSICSVDRADPPFPGEVFVKRALMGIALAILVIVAVLVMRTLRVAVPAAAPAAEVAGVAFDQTEAARRLAGAIRFATVSWASGAPNDTAAFLGLHDYLEATFPLVHSTLTREAVAGESLLYTWTGRDPSLDPVVLMGHMDVVPVPEENATEWSHLPFAGDIADGFVWGRGTLDDKTTVLSILEAVEGLIREGYQPPRTVYLTFGHDEEVGGRYGARAMVDLLVSRGVHPSLVLDEGGFMASGVIPGLAGRTAIVGIAEKGYISLRLRAQAQGGHSSMPTGRTAVGALSRAITTLEANPFPSSLDGPTRGMLEAMAPWAPFGRRLVLANLWLTAPLVRSNLAASPLGAALTHTTTSPTMLEAGVKDNVLPPEATGVVNFRIRPGETISSVTRRVQDLIADPQIIVEPLDSAGADPSPVSDINSPAYHLIDATIHAMTPGEALPVLPYLVMGGTDAKYWGAHSDRVFRFLAIPLGDGDLERIHGVNERVPVADYASCVNFFARLLRGLDRLQ
jgi:carboxypeptidase PM20D1